VIKDRFAPELNLGFFFANGDDAFHQRKMFSNIFHYDNLSKQIPEMNRIVEGHMKKIAK
jgi:hypothetical protein